MHTERKGNIEAEAVSLHEAARLLSYSARHVRRLVESGKLAARRTGAATGSRYAIPRTDVNRIAEERGRS
jgi:excisionase family DNA binding protein